MVFPFEIRHLPFDQERVLTALARLNLGHEFLEKQIKEVSGGEEQRVAVVRNLISEPKVLLLDQVSSGLDEKTKTLLRTFLTDLHQAGVTLIEVTHDQREIETAGRLLTIVEGRLAHE